MRDLLERSSTARVAVALCALAAILALVRGATAGDDPGFRRFILWPEDQPAAQPIEVQAPPPVRHRHARRVWAASRSRPLRVTLARRAHLAHAHPGRPRVAAVRPRPPGEPQVVFAKLLVLPKPERPALVSIYEDRTLRNGDAVMLADGIHVFRGFGEWPHQPREFVRLTFAAALDWHLRRSLDALDKNPPTRWTSITSSAG